MRILTLLALASLVATPALAETRDWHTLNFEDGTCDATAKTTKGAFTPEQFHKGLRAAGVIDSVDVEKNDDGSLRLIAFSFKYNGADETSLWFPDLETCEIVRNILHEKGDLTESNDLK